MKGTKFVILLIFLMISAGCNLQSSDNLNEDNVKQMVYKHARAWETGDYELFDSILHQDLIFAYPGRRMSKEETLKDFIDYKNSFNDTKIYINKILIDDGDIAVEWQFASTNKKTGNRTAVSDAIIGKVKDGKIIIWKEYLDGRVSRMQAAGNLSLDEGQEPFPWPRKK